MPLTSLNPIAIQRTVWQALCATLIGSLICGGSGCAGYRFGSSNLFRPDVRTVHVPVFESDSFRKNLGERLTEAIVKQVELTSHYKVVSAGEADSILSGAIVTDTKRVIAEDRNDMPRDIDVNMEVQLRWENRQGDLIRSGWNIPLPPEFLQIGKSANFVPEAGQSITTAQQEAIEGLAAGIVSQMEMPW
ncbi:MAG: LPS assembly lipoprotein LptE [Planctomycetota bacterium]|nr:LPS assembly lipoprotein LptE [Planctomycetota bacterium]MDA1178964.1 LPS assembly lipoprotein LptE [Planctomycetota bacterium]